MQKVSTSRWPTTTSTSINSTANSNFRLPKIPIELEDPDSCVCLELFAHPWYADLEAKVLAYMEVPLFVFQERREKVEYQFPLVMVAAASGASGASGAGAVGAEPRVVLMPTRKYSDVLF
jgi:hypothetical protein